MIRMRRQASMSDQDTIELVETKLQRVSADHILDLYTGFDEQERNCIALITKTVPTPANMYLLKPSQEIDVHVRTRLDGQSALVISLQAARSSELFEKFKQDIIESSSRLQSATQGLPFIAKRYSSWQKLFLHANSGKLSLKEIKGLFGELFFLESKMIPRYGHKEALDSWIGLDGTDQDFRIDDTWYEVKTTTSGNPLVKISSIEQLDCSQIGFLVVLSVDQTSPSDDGAKTIAELVREITTILSVDGYDDEFIDLLREHGYCDLEEYDQYHFKTGSMNCYVVDSNFPALRRSEVKYSEIVNAVYQLDVSSLQTTDI